MERDEITMLVVRNIEATMARKGLTPAEVQRRADMGQTGLYDILKGKSRSPRIDTLQKLAIRGLGVPVASLLMDPSEDDIDQELVEILGMLPPEERRRFLNIARAYRDSGVDKPAPTPPASAPANPSSEPN